jgi:hypothetical protein
VRDQAVSALDRSKDRPPPGLSMPRRRVRRAQEHRSPCASTRVLPADARRMEPSARCPHPCLALCLGVVMLMAQGLAVRLQAVRSTGPQGNDVIGHRGCAHPSLLVAPGAQGMGSEPVGAALDCGASPESIYLRCPDLAGKALEGGLEGCQLHRVPARPRSAGAAARRLTTSGDCSPCPRVVCCVLGALPDPLGCCLSAGLCGMLEGWAERPRVLVALCCVSGGAMTSRCGRCPS